MLEKQSYKQEDVHENCNLRTSFIILENRPIGHMHTNLLSLNYNINITLTDNFSHGQVPYRTSAVYRFRDISI